MVALGTAAEPPSCSTTPLVEACDEQWGSKKLVVQTGGGVQARFLKVLQSIYGDSVQQADLHLGFC